jgi:DNA-binding LytR/AlgR family response regulator
MTSSREEAVDAFALGALHYLVKPLDQAQVDSALKRVNDKQVFDQKKLILPGRDGQIVIWLSQIHYIESFGNYKDIKTDEGVISVRKSTSEVLAWLQGDLRFYPLSRSFIVNFDFVKSLKADGLLLTSGELLPFPRDKKKAISAAFLSYIRA